MIQQSRAGKKPTEERLSVVEANIKLDPGADAGVQRRKEGSDATLRTELSFPSKYFSAPFAYFTAVEQQVYPAITTQQHSSILSLSGSGEHRGRTQTQMEVETGSRMIVQCYLMKTRAGK